RADGQHGDLEAVAHPAAVGALPDAPAGGGSAAAPPGRQRDSGGARMVPGDGRTVSRVALAHEDLAGIHFTGSTGTFQTLWRTVGQNISSYRSYPRLVGETGGQGLRTVQPSAEPQPP